MYVLIKKIEFNLLETRHFGVKNNTKMVHFNPF